MNCTKRLATRCSTRLGTLLALCLLAVVAQAQNASHFVGAVTAISEHTLTVKTDTGDQRQFDVTDSTQLKRIAPGEKDLSSAVSMTFGELAVGDRVLVRLNPDASTTMPQALQIIAIKAQDLATKQAQINEAWQRGPKGLVKSVDPSTGRIVVGTGAGPTAKTVTVRTSSATVLKRYAPGSIRFADAQPAPLSAVKPGDQLRARGRATADGNEFIADEVVSGTFRNLAGTVTSVDPGASTLVIKDLASKKSITIHIAADTQMHKIPERMAQALAARLKGTSGAAGGSRSGGGQGSMSARPASGQWGGSGGQGSGPGAQGGGDPQRFLAMAPAIKLADLQKGDAVMVVATNGETDVNAITLLAGVEPLLQAPAASDLLSNWSMGGGGGAEAAGGGPQ